MSDKTGIVYSEKFLEHKTGAHYENPRRLTIALQVLKNLNIFPSEKCVLVEPREASIDELKLVHDKEYIETIRRFSLSGGGYYDGDTVLSRESFDVARLAVGGMLKASLEVYNGKLRNAFGLIRPPGHHAGFSGVALGAPTVGFCVFNNVAVVTAYMLQKGYVKKVVIFDFDVHHGNGTQEIFNSSAEVLYISTHERGIYPGTGYEYEVGVGEGEGFKVNIPMPHRADDDAYLKALNEVIIPVVDQFKPDIIFLSAGFDAHHSDTISTTTLSVECYLKMVEEFVGLAEKHCNGKIIGFLEGGYSRETLSKSLPAVVATLAGINVKLEDEKIRAPETVSRKVEETISKVKKVLSKYWKI
ncbi:MAG: histone deacetylase family protein [Candidatus Bathyarchaeota archaeon]